MNEHTRLLGFAALAVVALLASCSSDDDNGGNGSGGSSAGTSASTGGKAGSGSGGSTSTAGSAGRANGGTGSGGRPATGGSGGFNFGGFTLGGAGPNPDDFQCDPVPQPGSACTAESEPCLNGTEVCLCSMEEWSCMDIFGGSGGTSGGELECPSTKPMAGSACDTFGVCPYGAQGMGCACDGSMWVCN